jgi:hypothetical protein
MKTNALCDIVFFSVDGDLSILREVKILPLIESNLSSRKAFISNVSMSLCREMNDDVFADSWNDEKYGEQLTVLSMLTKISDNDWNLLVSSEPESIVLDVDTFGTLHFRVATIEEADTNSPHQDQQML